jgi:hypothetical protein
LEQFEKQKIIKKLSWICVFLKHCKVLKIRKARNRIESENVLVILEQLEK